MWRICSALAHQPFLHPAGGGGTGSIECGRRQPSGRDPRFVTDELEATGCPLRRSYRSYHFAGVHAIGIDGGRWQGGADPGRDGMALEV